jgi:hypothetical protein
LQRFLEILLGLDAGFLARDGAYALDFRPRWPMQEALGAASWNVLLVTLATLLVVWIYRREGKRRRWRIALGTGRLLVLLCLIALLNRPTLTLTTIRVEPSVLAVLIDDSASMSVADVPSETGEPTQRLAAATGLINSTAFPAELAESHELRRFRFAETAVAVESFTEMQATSESTRVSAGIADALRQLRGQNLAGVIVLSDGRDAPGGAGDPTTTSALRSAGVPVWTVPVGGPGEPQNLRLESVSAEPTVFAGDVLNIRVQARAVGFDGPAEATVRLVDADTGEPTLNPDGSPVQAVARFDDESPVEVELLLETDRPTQLDLRAVVEAPAGVREIDPTDNARSVRADVLEAEIAVLYVDGYPRWEYRYLKNRLIRDGTVVSSILLTSADPDFPQEGDRPIRRFPVSMQEMLDYDVVLLGDVSPRQFSDGQLELLREFVGENGGGFGMIAGPRFSPWDWAGTAVEALLPVDVAGEPGTGGSADTAGWRPVVTEAGTRTGMFRFFTDPAANERFLEAGIEPLFWYASGLRPKAGVGDVLAEHPDETGPDGQPAPLLVAGRYGAGRTLFNAIDESWRWRFYTGEGVFDTFWIQQIRYLARGRKLGQRRAVFDLDRSAYELGDRARAELRILDPRLASDLPDRLDANLVTVDGTAVAAVPLTRRQGEGAGTGDRFTGTFNTDRAGTFELRLDALSPQDGPLDAALSVELPRAELERPAVDRTALARLATETGGGLVELTDAGALPDRIASVERRVPVATDRSLWDAPLALALLAVLLTLEWVGRKAAGLV